MLISHLVLPLVPRLLPEAPITCGMLVLLRFFNLSFSYISSDITLFIAPVSKSVLIWCSNYCLQIFGILCLLLVLTRLCCRYLCF